MNSGIQPTVELATNNGNGFGYPVMPAYNYGNNGFFGGSDAIWGIILLALLFNNGNFGNFGGNGWNNVATTDFVSSEFTQRDISQLSSQVSNGFADNATNICNLRSDVLTGNMALQNSIMDSKYSSLVNAKDIERDVLMQTTQLENQASVNALNASSQLANCCCELKAQGLENTQRILDAMNANTIADLREKLNEAQTEISNRNIESSIISSVRPYPVPSYIVSSPYQSIYNPFGFNGGFYGNGFYGNTIV